MKNTKYFIEKVVENVEEDRATAKTLLTNAMIYLNKNEENHKSVGPIIAKYLETLQRSNEQLVKIATLVQKKDRNDNSITDYDRDDIFEQIQDSGEQK